MSAAVKSKQNEPNASFRPSGRAEQGRGYRIKLKIHSAQQCTYRNIRAEYSATNTAHYNKHELIW